MNYPVRCWARPGVPAGQAGGLGCSHILASIFDSLSLSVNISDALKGTLLLASFLYCRHSVQDNTWLLGAALVHYGMFSGLRRLHIPGKSPLSLSVKIPNISRDCVMSPGGTAIPFESQILCDHSRYYSDFGQPLHPSTGLWGGPGGLASDTPYHSPCMTLRG